MTGQDVVDMFVDAINWDRLAWTLAACIFVLTTIGMAVVLVLAVLLDVFGDDDV